MTLVAFALTACRSNVGPRSEAGRRGAAPNMVGPTSVPPPTAPALPATTAASAAPAVSADRPCDATTAPPPSYEHVVWIWMENHSFDQVMSSAGAPYLHDLASRCGLATSYRGVTHPSLPNYLAAAGGSTFGVADDADPSVHPIGAPSIFGQVTAAGHQWRTYAESMPAPCTLTAAGRYAVKHNPATYFTAIRDDCRRWDLPLGTASSGALHDDISANQLPALAVIVPDICSDTHDCPVATGDAWLRGWVTALLDSASYRAGRTALFVTWDEGAGGDDRIPTVVVAPSVASGTTVDAALDHYALLRTTEELLGLPTDLAASATAPSMRPGFHL